MCIAEDPITGGLEPRVDGWRRSGIGVDRSALLRSAEFGSKGKVGEGLWSSTERVDEEAGGNTAKGGINEREGVFMDSSLNWSITTEGCRDTLGAVRARDFGTGLKRGPPFSAKE